MPIYKRKKSSVWWYSIYAPTGRRRGSTGTSDRSAALLVEATMRQALCGPKGTQTICERLQAIIAAALGVTDSTESEVDDIAIEALWSEVERQIESSGKRLEKHSLQRRRQTINRFVEWASVNWPSARTVRLVDRRCAQAFAQSLSDLSSKSVANLVGELSACWSILSRAYDDLANPWPMARPAVVESVRGMAFREADIPKLLAAADKLGYDWGLASRIALATGMRYGDICRLNAEDVVDGIVRIMPNKTKLHGIYVQVPLPGEVVKMLPRSGPVVPILSAAYRTMRQFKPCPYSMVLREAGLDGRGYTFHSWRHTFRTRLSAAGVADEVAKRLGGWTEDATATRYDHDGRIKELKAAVEAAWNRK